MRYLFLVAALLLGGCIGSASPHNPMDRKSTMEPWWQASTAGITSENPWEIYVPRHKTDAWDDPWSTYQEPDRFPKGLNFHLDTALSRPINNTEQRIY